MKILPKAVSYRERAILVVSGWSRVASTVDLHKVEINEPLEVDVEMGLDGNYWIAAIYPKEKVVPEV